jgi:hypothetical protein
MGEAEIYSPHMTQNALEGYCVTLIKRMCLIYTLPNNSMGRAHTFFIDDLATFVAHLEARRYSRGMTHDPEEDKKEILYSRSIGDVITKYYSYDDKDDIQGPIRIRVTYALLNQGKSLSRLAKQLKALNVRYRQTLPDWKTKRKARVETREKRWADVQRFLRENSELISCFKYQGDDRLTEGNHSFNLEIASTPQEQAICFEFIKALVDAYEPHGIIRGRRGPDKPREQRNGWIRRYADMHKKRGWTPLEISKEIQRELREGTWNERSRLQYNLAQNTILRIAGMKIHHSTTIN